MAQVSDEALKEADQQIVNIRKENPVPSFYMYTIEGLHYVTESKAYYGDIPLSTNETVNEYIAHNTRLMDDPQFARFLQNWTNKKPAILRLANGETLLQNLDGLHKINIRTFTCYNELVDYLTDSVEFWLINGLSEHQLIELRNHYKGKEVKDVKADD